MDSNNPYGAKLPPSLVTVENGFNFNDDSDLSSLNTTPRKQEQRKSLLTSKVDPNELLLEEADLELKLSNANRKQPPWNKKKDPPPLSVVQVGEHGTSSRNNNNDTTTDPVIIVVSDPRASRDEENLPAIMRKSRSRDEKLRDRKEKYRRMASPSSRRSTRRSGATGLNSWRKTTSASSSSSEKRKPWFVPVATNDEEEQQDDNNGTNEQDNEEEEEDDVSPMKATKHTFDDIPMDKQQSTAVKKQSPKKKPKDDALVVGKFTVKRESPTPNVDMYGCPIFSVEEDEELEETRAKLDKLDKEQEGESDSSIQAMLSSASFFSKSAAQTLKDPTVGGITKFIGDAAQGVEALVLGPLEEEEEDAHSTASSNATPPPPPPPPPRSRGRSPTRHADATNSAARRMYVVQQDESITTNSFVLDDKSEVDVPAALNVTSHYVLDDLATMEKNKNAASKKQQQHDKEEVPQDEKSEVAPQDETSEVAPQDEIDESAGEPTTETDETTKQAPEKEPAKEQDSVVTDEQVVMDVSSENEMYVEDDKVASIDEELDACVEEMDAIHVREEVQRLESIHAAEAAKRMAAAAVLGTKGSKEAANETMEVSEENEEQKSEVAAPEDEVCREIASAEDDTAEDVPTEEESHSTPADDETPSPPETSSDVMSGSDYGPSAKSNEDSSARSNGVASPATVGVSVVTGAAVVMVAVTPDKEEIERDPGQLVIAAPNGNSQDSDEEEPEFPPTDDADVDMINFDTISVKSDDTPVRQNHDGSRNEEEKATEPAWKADEALEDPAPPEAAPETLQEKEMKQMAKRQVASLRNKRTSPKVAARKDTSSSSKDASTKDASGSKDAASTKPAMVKTLDDNNGIAKGDMVLSLLNTNLSEANRAPKGADQVRDAIMRMRDMRRRQEKVEMPEYKQEETASVTIESPSKRSALPVDVDEMHVVGATNHVKTLEEDAIEHLKNDEIEAALELYEEVITIYTESFKDKAKKRKKKDKNDHKAYIGAALHNIGILHLLRFDFEEALSYFEKSAENRKDHFGEGSVDHLASIGKIALCHYAMDEYETAHKSLENVLELSKNHLAGLTDFMQVAEVLNNLGCLSFMCGQTGSAMTMFKECLEIQTAVLKQSLYGGPRFAGQSTSLNISVTRGNIGYVHMLTKNAGPAIIEFEASLMHQQMILGDVHDTLICTMDHLAVANLLAKNKEEAIKMLGRMLRAQLAAYGPLDERCILTLSKLQLVQTEQTDYLEKALEQLWNQHSTSASPRSKATSVATSKKSNKMLKKLSFRKKVQKL